MEINKRISLIERRAKLFTPNSDWGINITEKSTAEELAHQLISENAIPEMRFGYAIRELFIALGKLFRLYDTAQKLLGEQSERSVISLIPRCHQILLPLYPSDVDFNFSDALIFFSQVTTEFNRGRFEYQHLISIESRRDFLGITARYIDEKAIEEFFKTFGHAYDSELVNEIENNGHLTTYLKEKYDHQIQWMIQNYRTSEWLLPWIISHESTMNLGQSYNELFEYEKEKTEKTMQIAENIFNQILKENPNLDINTDNLRALLKRISETIQHDGYRNFVDIAKHAERYGPNSVLGADAINVIPSMNGGVTACCDIAVTIAKGKGIARRWCFGSVLRELRGHLLKCGRSTKIVLILSDTEDASALKENNLDLQYHRDQGIVFVPLYVIDDQVTAMPIGWLGLR